MRLLITRPLPEAQVSAKRLEERGFTVDIKPLSKFTPFDVDFITEGYEAVIFTSKRAIREVNLPVFKIESDGVELALRINASPYKRFIWGAGEQRAVDLQALCPTKTIDLVVLYKMIPLEITLDPNIAYNGVLHFSAKHAEMLIQYDDILKNMPHFCLSKRIENRLPKGYQAMSAKEPTEESLITLVEEQVKPDVPLLEKPKSFLKTGIIIAVISSLVTAGSTAFLMQRIQPEPANLQPLLTRLATLEAKPSPVIPVMPDISKDLERLKQLNFEVQVLHEKALKQASTLDILPLERRFEVLEKNQPQVLAIIERFNRETAVLKQIESIKAPKSSDLLESLPKLKLTPDKKQEGALAFLSSVVKISKTGDHSFKELEKALKASDLKATQTAWTALSPEIRSLNPEFEANLTKALEGEKAILALKSELKRD